jgi:hypothetical protein
MDPAPWWSHKVTYSIYESSFVGAESHARHKHKRSGHLDLVRGRYLPISTASQGHTIPNAEAIQHTSNHRDEKQKTQRHKVFS